jgi:glucan phosphoethanolaminetransferase (alkaline phosphatase superfamily)
MDHHDPAMERKHYGRLALMIVLSFISMYILMYAMVDKAANIHPSLNQAYMAGLMTAPMVVIELLLMSMMYTRRGLNTVILVASLVIGLACFIAIRQQFLIGDREFLRSMIPHHSGAILMCGKAPIRDPELKKLCASIIQGQQAEIDQMNTMLRASR